MKYEYCVEFYGTGLFIKRVYVHAKNREEAIKKVRDSGAGIVEMIRCRIIDTW